jgi:xanthine/uracil permease
MPPAFHFPQYNLPLFALPRKVKPTLDITLIILMILWIALLLFESIGNISGRNHRLSSAKTTKNWSLRYRNNCQMLRL